MRATPPRSPRGFAHAALHRIGVDLIRYSSTNFFELRRQRFIEDCGINVVLDGGANTGQYALDLRARGYEGRIVSFEPEADSFQRLAAAAESDARWTCLNVALGDTDDRATINVSRNSWSSSLLPMSERHLSHASDSAYVRTQEVSVVRLDSVAPDVLSADGDRVLLKLDVQGFELPALRGAGKTLERVSLVEAELSFVPLYGGQATIEDVVGHLSQRGFDLVWLEPGSCEERSGHVLQADGIFARSSAPPDTGDKSRQGSRT